MKRTVRMNDGFRATWGGRIAATLLACGATAAWSQTADTNAAPAAPAAPEAPAVQVYTGVVEGVGSKGDGRLKVDGTTVYIPGAAQGERVVFDIKQKRDRYWLGHLIETLGAAPAGDAAPAAETKPGESTPAPAAPAAAAPDGGPPVVGQEHDVTIAEDSRGHPGEEGVVRVGGMVVFVPGTKPGDQVKIRITEVKKRVAIAEVVSKKEGDAPAAAPAPAAEATTSAVPASATTK